MSSAWYGDVPDDWESVSLRYLAQSSTGGTPDRSNSDFWDGDIPWVSPKDMKSSEITDAEEYVTDEAVDRSSTTIVPTGSILVVARSGILDHSIPVAVAASPVAINQDIRAYTLRDDSTDPEFLQSFIASHENALLNLWRKQGATVQSLDSDAMADAKFPIPPIEEQRSIADFLDRRTARIDALIEKQKRLLDLLDERRHVLISQAVTQGLKSDREMKSSSISGVDTIPKAWDEVPLRYSSPEIGVGIVIKPSQYYTSDGVPALRSLNVETNRIVENDFVHISEEANKDLDGSRLNAGDLVAVRSGDPGTTAVVPERLDGVNCIDLIIIREPDKYLSEFLSLLMNSKVARGQIELRTGGALQQHFNVAEVKNLVFPNPPIDEQKQILEWIASKLSSIDQLRSDARDAINLFQEKRQALITAAVTGQIDVTEDRGETQTVHK